MTTTLSNDHLLVQIKHFGAELCSIKSQETEYIWQAKPEYWGKHAPVLFPIVGSLKNNSYLINNSQYHLSRHGFAREMIFEVVHKTPTSVIFSLKQTQETLQNYPFEFELQIKYEILENKLVTSYTVKNYSTQKMPFSIGAHPAFSLPNSFEDYSLSFDQNEQLECYLLQDDLLSNTTKNITLNNKQLALNYALFADDAMVFKNIKSKKITILEHQKPLLALDYNDFPDLGIWTKNQAAFLCLEPWFGYADTKNCTGAIWDKEGIISLEADGVFECSFIIEIF